MPLDVLFYSCIIGFIECFKNTRIHIGDRIDGVWNCIITRLVLSVVVPFFPALWIIKFWYSIPQRATSSFCSLSSKAMVLFASSHFLLSVCSFRQNFRNRKPEIESLDEVSWLKLNRQIVRCFHHVFVIGKWKQVSRPLQKETNSYHTKTG
jgi:hypothetical protein